MLCYIGYLPPKEFQDFYKDLAEEISQEFRLAGLAQKRRIPHITFKSPFKTDSPKALDSLLADFCQHQRASEMKISGIGSFEDLVVYMAVEPSLEMSGTLKSLLDNLVKLPSVEFGKYDKEEKRLHITIAKMMELGSMFQAIYDYLNNKNIQLTLPFNNLTIFEKQERTNVYRTYSLG